MKYTTLMSLWCQIRGENGLTKSSNEINSEDFCLNNALLEKGRDLGVGGGGPARRAFTYVKNMTEGKIYKNSVGTFLHLLLSH